MTLQGIDCNRPIPKPAAEQLYQLGYRFAGRYLVPENYRKHLSLQEAEILSEAGFMILSIFETTADRAKGGEANGTEDGAMALAAARKINMPENAYIYFAVDFNATSTDMDAIEAYLRAAALQTAPYKVGVYGSYSVIETMAMRGACSGFYQTYAWSKKKKSEHTTVYQYLGGQTAADMSVDMNVAYSEEGLWKYSEQSDDLKKIVEAAKNELLSLDETGNEHSPWTDDAVTRLTAAGLFKGDGEGNYGWEKCVTREVMAEVLYRMLSKLGLLDELDKPG